MSAQEVVSIPDARFARGIARVRQNVPVTFCGLTGSLHNRPDKLTANVAVLICPPINRDLLDAHHALAVLADAVAQAGFPTLRFDYQGIGDSSDLPDPAQGMDNWDIWQRNVQDAADWLRKTTSARRLVFCGLRFGALAATCAIEGRSDVAGLMLLAPVLRGQSYLRQIWVRAKVQRDDIRPLEEGMIFQELQFSARSVDMISRINLRAARGLTGMNIAVFTPSASPLLDKCVAAWQGQGIDVQQHEFLGLEAMLQYNLHDEIKPLDPSATTAWLARAFPVQSNAEAVNVESAVLRLSDCSEMPILFGSIKHLFGVHCLPAHQASKSCVILVNSGRSPHYGLGRFHVVFARQLAACGIASFRMDFAGIGESLCGPGQEDIFSPIFDWDRSADIQAAAEALSHFGYKHFAIYGLSSGAYHAMRGAFANPLFSMLLLVNLRPPEPGPEDAIGFAKHAAAPQSFYLKMVMRKEFWRGLVSQRIGLGSILVARSVRFRELLAEKFRRWLRLERWTTRSKTVSEMIQVLSNRGVNMFFIFGSDDPGLISMEHEFEQGLSQLQSDPHVRLRILPDIDHVLGSPLQQQRAIGEMLEFLKKQGWPRYG